MAKYGKISPIKKEYQGSILTLEKSLASRGFTRVPGTVVYKFPYKELDGRYRTGLDENAAYISRIQDPTERELERDRARALREKLEGILGLDLGPRSSYWDYSKSSGPDDVTHVQPAKLIDGDNIFDFSNPIKELTFAWLRVHPTIASSYQAWERGEYPPDTQFYVVDDDYEHSLKYKRKQEVNKAIELLQEMDPVKRKKVARQLGLPVSDDQKETVVYNLIDDLLKQSEIKGGKHSGMNPVRVFMQYATMKEDLLHVKDLIKQAIDHSIFRVKSGGKIYKGDYEMAKDEEELIKYLMDENNQEDLIQLEQDLKNKKLASV